MAQPTDGGITPKTVLGVYMIGSDLEYDTAMTPQENSVRKEAATTDIREMLQGWGTGTQDLQVVVAYGGAQKEGWKGMTIATIPDLIADDENEIIGDTPGQYQRRENINMGSPEGLGSFLTFLQGTYPESRLILVLWDHGNAYLGYGRDDNYEGSQMSLADLQRGLGSWNGSIEILGFDACNMANVEVARSISPYARYMVASEESEPDHGWDYTDLVSTLINDPEISSESLGRAIIDAYSTNPDHQKGSLTLSLIDLSKTREMISHLGAFAQKLEDISGDQSGYSAISRVIGRLNGIGRSRDDQSRDVELLVDLQALSRISGEEIPSIQPDVDRLNTAFHSYVLYSRQDTPLKQISGLGIFSPIMANYQEWKGKISPGTVLDITPEWTSFITSLASQIDKDTVAPEVTKSGDGYKVIDDGYTLVTYVFYQIRPDGRQVVLAQEPAEPDDTGLYPAPDWNGAGIYLTDGTTSIVLPVYYVDASDDGVQLYYAWGTLQQGAKKSYIRIDLWYDPTTTRLSWSINPYEMRDGRQEFDRASPQLYAGDVLSAYTITLDSSGATKWEQTGSITWKEGTTVRHQKMPCGEYGLQILATDLNENTGESEIIPYKIPC
ncbi:MAG TPA: clostripain-related cysteine peptidase [Methanospirillum sp.]|nr:clostripain-related cysteine peptidase [Methanospirillum sp.]